MFKKLFKNVNKTLTGKKAKECNIKVKKSEKKTLCTNTSTKI